MSLTAGSSGLFGQQDDTRSDMVKLPKNWVVYKAGDHHCSVLSRFSFSPPISFGITNRSYLQTTCLVQFFLKTRKKERKRKRRILQQRLENAATLAGNKLKHEQTANDPSAAFVTTVLVAAKFCLCQVKPGLGRLKLVLVRVLFSSFQNFIKNFITSNLLTHA